MKSIYLTAAVGLLLVLVFGGIVLAFEEPEAYVDWEKGFIVVEGLGVPPEDAVGGRARLLAQRAARADAFRNAAEFIEGVNVTSTTTVDRFVVEDDIIRTSVEGLIEGGEFISIEYGEENICKVRLRVPLDRSEDSLTAFLERSAREEVEEKPKAERDMYQDIIDDREREEVGKEKYTGVIIDARGLGVESAFFPQIFDTDGHLLYGPTRVNGEPSDRSSLIAYSRSREMAEEMDRVGDNPYYLDALSVISGEGRRPVDIELDRESAGIFLEIDEVSGIVENRAVVMIID